jgi:hypothetical protein
MGLIASGEKLEHKSTRVRPIFAQLALLLANEDDRNP